MPKSKEDEKTNEIALEVGSGNIFSDLGFPEDQAVSMQARGQLAIEIRKIIEAEGLSCIFASFLAGKSHQFGR